MKIKQIKAREILDSRGNPTVEVEIFGEEKSFFNKKEAKAWASVPSGASTGDFEAVELRDGNKKRFQGKGVLKAIKNIEEIITPALIDMDVTAQKEIDEIMLDLDGTDNKANLGANAILGVSMAVARIGAIDKGQKLFEYVAELSGQNKNEVEIVRPFFNVINGGNHAGNQIAFQEFMISPNLGTFKDNYRAGSEIYHALQKNLKERFGGAATLLGDEGGFAPRDFTENDKALDVLLNEVIENGEGKGYENRINIVLDILMEAIRDAGYERRADIALDVAASEFFVEGRYNLGFKMDMDDLRTTEEMIEIYKNIVEKYPIISIEDPFDQTDFKAFSRLKKELEKEKVQVVGDDLTVSTPSRIQTAIDTDSCNALLLKLNQIGSVTEAIEAHQLAKSAGWKTMVSHRSGETTDDFIADFAVGIGAEQIKSGATARGERICKYNRLQAIEEMIKN